MAIAESILDEAVAALPKNAETSVERLILIVGELSGVDKDALSFALPFAAEGTPLEGAEFEFETERAEAKCRTCGVGTDCEFPIAACAECGSLDVQVLGGKGLIIKSMELKNV